MKLIPKETRPFFLPRTPDKTIKYSRRQWDGLIKAWKLQIHAWNSKGDNYHDYTVGEFKSEDVFPIDTWENEDGPSPSKSSKKNERSCRKSARTEKVEKARIKEEAVAEPVKEKATSDEDDDDDLGEYEDKVILEEVEGEQDSSEEEEASPNHRKLGFNWADVVDDEDLLEASSSKDHSK